MCKKDTNKEIEEALLSFFKLYFEYRKEEILKEINKEFLNFQDCIVKMSLLGGNENDESYKNCPYYKEENKEELLNG